MQKKNTISFYLNEERKEVHLEDPHLTVLEYLRLIAGMKGTKEGCAEGDCGACSAVLVTQKHGRLFYDAVNTCILFLPMIEGKQLLTVEHLQSNRQLHPCQAAIVEEHGSQCGFCTPGFVMSLFAFYHREKTDSFTREELEDALVGNLCRCTGYRPILDAGMKMMANAPQDQFTERTDNTAQKLADLEVSPQSFYLKTNQSLFFSPATKADFESTLSKHPNAVILGGATDVGIWVTKQRRSLPVILSVRRVKEFDVIESLPQETFKIYAGVTLQRVLRELGDVFPEFAKLLRRFASLQIRNSATLVGNVANASPIGDSSPALIAMNATVEIDGISGSRSMSVEDFFVDYRKTRLQPGEYVTAVTIAKQPENSRLAIYKVSKRFDQDISAVCAAFRVMIDETGNIAAARFAYGGMAAIPKRAKQMEIAFTGKKFTGDPTLAMLDACQKDFQPVDDFRASAKYRMLVAKNLAVRFFREKGMTTKI